MTAVGAGSEAEWRGARSERLLAAGEVVAAARANDRALVEAPLDFGLTAQRVWIQTELQDMDAARSALDAGLRLAASAADLDQVFRMVPVVLEGWRRTAAWLAVRDRVAGLERRAPSEAGAVLALRLDLALRDHDGFLAHLDGAPDAPDNATLADLRRVGDVLTAARYPDFYRARVFGIGLGKTGTTSLTRALAALGFHAAHFTNPFTHEVLTVEDAFLFDALTDTPICAGFETLFHMFPNSRFVYTTRDPVAWQASLAQHNRRRHRTSDLEAIAVRLSAPGAAPHRQARAAIHASLYGGHRDPLSARTAYERRVMSFFSLNDPARLLSMDICGGEGWPRLCAFLARPVPPQAFPWENRTAPPPD